MNQPDKVINFLENTLRSDNFDPLRDQGYLLQYLNIKYYLTTIKYISGGIVTRGLVKLLFNTFKKDDSIFETRINFSTFNRWFNEVKLKIEKDNDSAFKFLDIQHKINILVKDKQEDVATATTKKTYEIKTNEGSLPAATPEKNFAANAAISAASAENGFSSYDPLALSLENKPKQDPLWDKIPKPVLPLKFLDVKGMEEHKLFDNRFCHKNYIQIIEQGENKGLVIDQKGFIFDPFTARPGSDFYKPEDHFNMIDPLPIPINMIKPMLLADAITFQYMKPDLFNRPAPATMHSIDLMNYLIKDYRKTILTNEPEKIFYKL